MYGQEIKGMRKQLNYTQKQVEQGTGIPQNTISWIESDKGMPNIQQIALLADFYQCSIDELIGRDGINNKKAVIYNHSVHNGDNKL